MLEVASPLSSEQLEEELAPLARELKLFHWARPAIPDPTRRQFVVSLYAEDRKGLVAKITSLLADHGVNISRMDAGIVGGSLYVMHFLLDLTDEVDQADVASTLREVLTSEATITNMEPVSAGLIAAVAKIQDIRLGTSLFRLDRELSESGAKRYRTGYFTELKQRVDER
jgi:predicted amino acid-binding ACT domain protein